MKVVFALLLSLLFMFFSCVERANDNHGQQLVSIEIDDLEIGLLEELIIPETIDTIKLEETDASLIGAIDKIQRYKGKFYVLDIRIANAVFIYNDDGKYLGKIHSVGEGYGSYYLPFDMIINPFTERIEIMDVRLRKILSYSLDGEFIEEWRIEDQLIDFAPLTMGKYVFHRDGREFEPGSKYPLLTISNSSNTVSYTEGMLEYGTTDYYPIMNNFSYTDFERLLYMHPMHDTIYEIQEEMINPVYFVDFKEKKVPYQLKSKDMMGFHQAYMSKDYYAINGNLLESSQFMGFQWLRKERGWENMGDDINPEFFFALFNKSTGNVVNMPISLEDGMRSANFPVLVSEDFFFSVHYPGSNNEGFSQESNPDIIKFKFRSSSDE